LSPIRAYIFDIDGLLINSEDIITHFTNRLLSKHRRPPFARSIRVQLMGVSNSTNGDTFHTWAQLPVPREQFAAKLAEEMRMHLPSCEPLPGAKELLANLSRVDRLRMALASTTTTHSYELKTLRPQTKQLLDSFQAEHRILSDEARVRREKPAPDIYFVALQAVNEGIDTPIMPIAWLLKTVWLEWRLEEGLG
jgi:pseudouridine-5'-monophosphatase